MPFELFPRLRSLGMQQPIAVVQVGASIGQELSEFVREGIRGGVFIEPLAEPFEYLSKICEPIESFIPVKALCAEISGKVYELHVANNGGQSSSILRPMNHLTVYPAVQFAKSVNMISTTLDDVLAEVSRRGGAKVVDAANLLYLDCQGAEFQILRGAQLSLSRFNYIYMEVMRNELYAEQVPFLTYCHYLEALGFELNDVYFDYPGQAGNALFIRRDLVSI